MQKFTEVTNMTEQEFEKHYFASRPQTKQMIELLKEFNELKEKIFQGGSFVEVSDTPEQKRYDQLLQFFYPQFRTKEFVSPLSEPRIIDIEKNQFIKAADFKGLNGIYVYGQGVYFDTPEEADKDIERNDPGRKFTYKLESRRFGIPPDYKQEKVFYKMERTNYIN